MEACHRADRKLIGRDAELRARLAHFIGRPRPAEILEGHAEIHHLDLGRWNTPRPHDELGCAGRYGKRDVGVRCEGAVGDLLKPGSVGQVGVLVQNGGNSLQRPSQPAERRGPIAVQVEDVNALPLDDTQQGRQCEGIELRSTEIGDVNAQRLQRFLRQVPLAKADEGDREALPVEPRDHPAEQALDAVHP